MRLAYFDCIAGISGDMALAALIDAGADPERIRAAVKALPLEPFEFEVEEGESGGIRALRANVRAMASGVIRTYGSIRVLLDDGALEPPVRHMAQRIFRRLAEAEARIHRKDVDTVTFHEVGAVDSIVDVVGVSVALHDLAVERVFASAVPTGMGMVRTEHGLLPIPGPAVTELLRGVPVYSRGVTAELVTPTGAAILVGLTEGFGEIPMMRVDAVGYGAGTHQLEFPNVLRVLLGEEAQAASGEPSTEPDTGEVVLETNVDDLTPELYGYVIERLLEAGAQDAWLTPIVMKKGRSAATISVLCSADRQDALRHILFREAGTLGVRTMPVRKQALDRETVRVETPHGTVGVKVAYLEGRAVTVAPEYEDCARVAREAGVPARDVYREALRLAHEQLSGLT